MKISNLATVCTSAIRDVYVGWYYMSRALSAKIFCWLIVMKVGMVYYCSSDLVLPRVEFQHWGVDLWHSWYDGAVFGRLSITPLLWYIVAVHCCAARTPITSTCNDDVDVLSHHCGEKPVIWRVPSLVSSFSIRREKIDMQNSATMTKLRMKSSDERRRRELGDGYF